MTVDAYKAGPYTNVECSPLIAKSMHGLPASYIQVAGRDPYRDEGLLYAQRLEEEGVLVRVRMCVFLFLAHI